MFTQSLLLLLASLLGRALAFSASSNQNVAVYWGQNSYGNQERLSYYCDSDDTDIILLAFVTGFPELSLNFANQCGGSFSNGVLHCSQIGEDIKTCQAKGKKVLLSLGGASGSYGFSGSNADSDAEEFAATLWNKFGAGSDDERPFDDAIVDGFDFDLENNNQAGTVALSNALRTQFAKDSSKQYYLSAAPQCVYPDASTGDILAETDIDFAFIQFYNNYCSLGANFNWDTWQTYAELVSPNKDIKLYVGLPGASSSAGSGYADLDTVKKYVGLDILNSNNFGGFMLWDASSGASNTANGVSFTQQLKNYLLGSGSSSSTSTTATSSATTATTSATKSKTSDSEPTQGNNNIAEPNVPGTESTTTAAPTTSEEYETTVTVPNPNTTLKTVRVSCSSDTVVNTVAGNVVTEVVTVTRVVSTVYATKTVKAQPTA